MFRELLPHSYKSDVRLYIPINVTQYGVEVPWGVQLRKVGITHRSLQSLGGWPWRTPSPAFSSELLWKYSVALRDDIDFSSELGLKSSFGEKKKGLTVNYRSTETLLEWSSRSNVTVLCPQNNTTEDLKETLEPCFRLFVFSGVSSPLDSPAVTAEEDPQVFTSVQVVTKEQTPCVRTFVWQKEGRKIVTH